MGLRRSCVFCRTRKIRCSGESICSACRKRNLSCEYSPEARKGRPAQRGTTTSQPPVVSQPHDKNGSDNLSLLSGTPAETSSTSDSQTHGHGESATSSDLSTHVGDELERRFNAYFITKTDSGSNIFQTAIATYQRELDKSPRKTPFHSIQLPLSYDGLLSFMASEMVGILPLRFSHLGVQQLEAPNQNFYVSTLAADTTRTMFDPLESAVDPLMVLGKHLILQLVDVWFSAHPLSHLVSKTLLATAIQDDTVDKALLAVILVDACDIQSIVSGLQKCAPIDPQTLYSFAILQLKQRTVVLGHPSVLSTAQALFLVGWRELCLGHARRATCFTGYACRIIATLYTFWQAGDHRKCSRKLNGVDVGAVEQELAQNVYWICLATTTWGFMQSNQPFSLLTPETTPDFPCLDEGASAILRLDRASGNISTLQAQIQATQCLWPLSHITSTVAHIYTLYLNAPTVNKEKQAVPWQKQHLHELHQLFQPCFDRSVLASRMHRILLNAIELVKNEVTVASSRSFLLTAYHSIAIHMLFSGDKNDQKRPAISPSVIDPFCQSASALLTILQQRPSRLANLMPTKEFRSVDESSIMLYALDTCSRGFSYIYAQHEHSSIEERNVISHQQSQLAHLANQLHEACKGDVISRLGAAILPVKKRLKRAKQAFEQLGSSAIPQSALLSSQNAQTPSSNSSAANDPLMDPGLNIGQMADPSLAPDGSESLPLMAIDQTLSLSENPCEIYDPGFFLDGPVTGSLLGFPGLAKMNMQLQDYVSLESDLDQDALAFLSQGTSGISFDELNVQSADTNPSDPQHSDFL
ncbi:Zn(II)2Cys6 transcription factor [Aspergillus luchuensis]|uniref:Zn(2)-C6 fungal-type domain-containing protein n=1 Tax=Aspergillus kawachii TaxID=1069201 RepID=A0A146FDR7_ASPKA|nr:uncharacterized protein AKAW2_11152S [Aspergillus luchuensis]BCR94106.1 hypothetical protein AKAW2_11152S [Aspergillus luchuensis]BCS06716.1 hypothetical protein ALUC_11097S [Aspergillus luchuensis]GAA84273.1 hypothetical protein AKAW_02388 [Aspergillus luchuensis IFO 4308]GAT24055.1 hypothetical protein RIB2604_01711980 [Aspergillus luchuensis]